MTVAARSVLEDCRGAVAELADGVQGPAWRRRWITAVVLLRAVGHILDKVDGQRSPEYRSAIDVAWSSLAKSRPEPQIFWDFIDDERNSILKQYELSAGQGVTVYVGSSQPPDYHYVMNTGPFAGREQRDLLREAIRWWEGYLDGIDRAAVGGAP